MDIYLLLLFAFSIKGLIINSNKIKKPQTHRCSWHIVFMENAKSVVKHDFIKVQFNKEINHQD